MKIRAELEGRFEFDLRGLGEMTSRPSDAVRAKAATIRRIAIDVNICIVKSYGIDDRGL